jgi:hypothetical protein
VGDDGAGAGDAFVIASFNMRISIAYLVVDVNDLLQAHTVEGLTLR